MKVYAEPERDDFCISRIAKALKQFAPQKVQFVKNEEEADIAILYVHGWRRGTWWRILRLEKAGKKAAIIQLSLLYTSNPRTIDWLDIWRHATLVWTYYNLPKICEEEGNPAKFNFYRAPLGVDSSVFKETPKERKYLIGIHAKGLSRESLGMVLEAARQVGGTVLNFETPKDFGPNIKFTGLVNDDSKLADYYSQCQYVAGLRRLEGFELPVIEGLLCGARPIVYDLDCYKQWFEGLAEFVKDEGQAGIIPALVEIFKRPPRPVSEDEKNLVRQKFNWQTIAEGFWTRLAV